MRVWRISNHADLSGLGGTLVSGRWHHAGRPILYTAEHPAAAMLEMLAHMDRADIPDNYQLLAIDIDEPFAREELKRDALTSDWRDTPAVTRGVGDAWLRSNASLALRVPSALAPQSWNYLINPRHADMARARIAQIEKAAIDQRLR
ncbi:MAG: RES family NAD+ phosphorylase [Hyphomicrobiales bacterium]|nr:RES family NAD+ phosphorylase [Hyphomicrobiales bacterium]